MQKIPIIHPSYSKVPMLTLSKSQKTNDHHLENKKVLVHLCENRSMETVALSCFSKVAKVGWCYIINLVLKDVGISKHCFWNRPRKKREREELTEQDPQLQLEQSPLQEQVLQVLLKHKAVSKKKVQSSSQKKERVRNDPTGCTTARSKHMMRRGGHHGANGYPPCSRMPSRRRDASCREYAEQTYHGDMMKDG